VEKEPNQKQCIEELNCCYDSDTKECYQRPKYDKKDIDYTPHWKWLNVLNKEVRLDEKTKKDVEERKKERKEAYEYLSKITGKTPEDAKYTVPNLKAIKELFDMGW